MSTTTIAPASAMQKPFPPRAGFVGEVPTAGPYGAFPKTPLERIRWAMAAPLMRPGVGKRIRDSAGKAILIVLAVHADESGKAWPAVATIAADASLDRRTVQRAIGRLVDAGWLFRYEREDRSALYWPMAPTESLCVDCWYKRPRVADFCPVCGSKGGASLCRPPASLCRP